VFLTFRFIILRTPHPDPLLRPVCQQPCLQSPASRSSSYLNLTGTQLRVNWNRAGSVGMCEAPHCRGFNSVATSTPSRTWFLLIPIFLIIFIPTALFFHSSKLSPVKTKILEILWAAGKSFPREWVKSSTLLKSTHQKYFDRRIRELRDQEGIDIETKYVGSEHCYRLNSPNLNEGHRRFYLSAADKRKLSRGR
jgi:hypothetical protein